MKSTTLQKILWGGPPLSLDKNFESMRRLKTKAAFTASASKQISATPPHTLKPASPIG